jgi:hypothetical protein
MHNPPVEDLIVEKLLIDCWIDTSLQETTKSMRAKTLIDKGKVIVDI